VRKSVYVTCALFMLLQIMRAQVTRNISLHDAISLGLEANPDILQALQEIKAAGGRVLQAGRIPNPEIGISINEVPSGYKIGSANEKDISISQSFEYPAKRSGRISNASLDEDRATATVEQRKARIAADIKKKYIDAQLAGISVGIIEQQIVMLQDLQQIVSNKYKSGESKYLDVLRIDVETVRLRNNLLETKNIQRSALSILKNAIGDSAVVLYFPSDSLIYRPISTNKDSLAAWYIANSHSRRLTELVIKKQESLLSLSRTNYYPDFGVGLAYQHRTPSSSYLGVELKVSVPLWYWQEPQGLIEEASAQLSVAELQMMSVERKIRNNVNNAFATVTSTEQQLKNYEQVLQKGLFEIMEVAFIQYRNNQIDLLNLFDIYRSQKEMRAEYIRSVANYQRAVADLESAAELPNE
jgi:cobalt-zinc-cadmium efflux system outer membrane protein